MSHRRKYKFEKVNFDKALLDKILYHKEPVIIWGIRTWFEELYEYLIKNDIKIEGIIDDSTNIRGTKVHGIEVFEPERYKNTDLPVIICEQVSVTGKYLDIYNKATLLGIRNIIPFYFIYSEKEYFYEEFTKLLKLNKDIKYIERIQSANEKSIILKHVELCITEKCSLRCENCSNLMQYFKHPKDSNIEETLLTVRNILNNIDYLKELVVMGGEPFLNKDFYKYINELKTYDNFGVLLVCTNGTIIPKGENLECLKEDNICIRISNYGGISSKKDELKRICEREGILCVEDNAPSWIDCSGDLKFNGLSDDKLENLYRSCVAKDCLQIKNETFYACSFVPGARKLKAIPSEDIEDGKLEINKVSELEIREQLEKFLDKKFIGACKYCSGRDLLNGKRVEKALQTSKPMEYKKYE